MSSPNLSAIVQSQSVDLVRIRSELDLSRERMARLFDVSAKTIERWEARRALPRDHAARKLLSELREMVDLGKSVYGTAGFHRFLALPIPSAGQATPLQLIERGEIGTVLAALAADYEGLGA
jgi:DNA-binding XRE family transcriptional regulator